MVVQDERSLTYNEAFAQAAALGQALRDRFGVVPGTKVAVVMSNRIEWIVSVLAITAIGGVAALVNSRGVAEEMVRAIETAQCTVAILDDARDDIMSAELADPAWPRIVIGTPALPLRAGPQCGHAAEGGALAHSWLRYGLQWWAMATIRWTS